MQSQQTSSYLWGGNLDYIEAIYEDYLTNPDTVSADWATFFKSLAQGAGEISHTTIRDYFLQLAKNPVYSGGAVASTGNTKAIAVMQLIIAYRVYGHYAAKTDPLKLATIYERADLTLAYHGLTEADWDQTFAFPDFYAGKTMTLREIFQTLNAVYASSIGIEYIYIADEAERLWVQSRFESTSKIALSFTQKKRILAKLTAAEGLEKYLGNKYVGQKRFSLEGGDVLIPMLDNIIQRAGDEYAANEVVLGMAHRGRLNVLLNIVGQPSRQLFDAFEGKISNGRSGDVKYHSGASSFIRTSIGHIHVVLAFNPSHLEIINPVVEGSVRARQVRRQDSVGATVIPVLIHGDAAFAGQGVVMETLALSQTQGYYTGGTVHIVLNNQVGFTTDPMNSRSSFYCTDIAKMIDAPVFHVNGDDVEAVLFVVQTALDFRMKFKKDVVVDVICFRRHGHNEADEPSATQPLMYQVIKQHPGLRQLYADKLLQEGIVNTAEIEGFVSQYRNALDQHEKLVDSVEVPDPAPFLVNWHPYLNRDWREPMNTGLALTKLKALGKALCVLPKSFTLQAQVGKMFDERKKMLEGEIPLNWGCAETLAYARLLTAGYPIRLSGQDSGRGTFSHRHAVLHDYKTGETYSPLCHLTQEQAHFTVIDSVLSEEAVLGYEYGFAAADPNTLVIWEAQYGDFANGAQVVMDQFISSGEQKWGRLCGLVMLLPHGYEGAGPEHSSARLERYLQLCAQQNIQVCNLTTPAQIFHVLCRQMMRPYRKPLVIMSPKSLLRHKLVVSTLDDLATGRFEVVIPEVDAIKPSQTRRVVLCSGKVYYDLLERRRANPQQNVAIIRIEQIYPFPEEELRTLLTGYSKTSDVVWCQEEPLNQGAWYAMQHHLRACLAKGQTLQCVAREAFASPAVGYLSVHLQQQEALLDKVFEE